MLLSEYRAAHPLVAIAFDIVWMVS